MGRPLIQWLKPFSLMLKIFHQSIAIKENPYHNFKQTKPGGKYYLEGLQPIGILTYKRT